MYFHHSSPSWIITCHSMHSTQYQSQTPQFVYKPLLQTYSPTKSTMKSEIDYGLMELLWQGEFGRLFNSFMPVGHQWFLMPTAIKPDESQYFISPLHVPVKSLQWKTFRDSAKVRFCCDSCGNGWTSMKGRIISWFALVPEHNMGFVLFRLFGQKCKRCMNENFEHAMWYPDEVLKVVNNVYQRVGQAYYGFVTPPLRIDRRHGKPKEQHNAELCQACHDGFCREEQMFT